MTDQELFNEENIELFMPDGIEFFHNILLNTGYKYSELKSKEARKYGLEVIKKLLEIELVEVFHWGKYNNILKNKHISKQDTINYIKKTWFEGADIQDFYGMIMLKYKDWYLKALEKEGLTHTTDWKYFVENKIGNLEKWIEENRPKK